MKLLLVDDDPSALATLRIALTQAGFSVTAAAGGEEALRLLRGQAFDALVTDARMQPYEGPELAEKAAELQPGIREAVVSGFWDPEDLAPWPHLRLFPKPVDVDALASYLRVPL